MAKPPKVGQRRDYPTLSHTTRQGWGNRDVGDSQRANPGQRPLWHTPIALIRSARPRQNRERWGSAEIIPPCRTQRDKGGATESLVTRREQIWASALQVPQWGLAHTFEFLGPSATTTKAAPLAAVFGEWVPRTPRAWHNSITMQSGAPASPPSAPHSPAPVPLLPKHNDGSCSNSIVPAPVPDRAQLGCDACSEASPRASSP